MPRQHILFKNTLTPLPTAPDPASLVPTHHPQHRNTFKVLNSLTMGKRWTPWRFFVHIAVFTFMKLSNFDLPHLTCCWQEHHFAEPYLLKAVMHYVAMISGGIRGESSFLDKWDNNDISGKYISSLATTLVSFNNWEVKNSTGETDIFRYFSLKKLQNFNRTKLKFNQDSKLVDASALNLRCWMSQSTQCLGYVVFRQCLLSNMYIVHFLAPSYLILLVI